MSQKGYPGLIERVKAVIADAVVIILLMFAASSVFSSFENVPNFYRVAVLVFLAGLYDPIFTSTFGGTLGHIMIGIRVKAEDNEEQNIMLPQALFRYVVKGLLGWISLLSLLASGNPKRRALHDFAAGSVVIYRQKKNAENE
jgi:uncharacterized RDD family membrane protein YckC